MRLLDVHTKKLHTFYEPNIPWYGILSHTWLKDDEEVTFAQIQTPEKCVHMLGYQKIDFCCQRGIEHGLQYVWIDTCSIDKTNSAELSEAINSMFSWYQKSTVCYVYLADVDVKKTEDFHGSRWWTRAWTLQELLAPNVLYFYDKASQYIGSKENLAREINRITGIDAETLTNYSTMMSMSIAQRMSWASRRVATRTEDVAYSLLGIFDINMPLLYGEGKKAFLRLQREIMRTTNDPSLFAWGLVNQTIQDLPSNSDRRFRKISQFALFANSPGWFTNCGGVTSDDKFAHDIEILELRGALSVKAPHLNVPHGSKFFPLGQLPSDFTIMLIPCREKSYPGHMLGTLLVKDQVRVNRNRFHRTTPDGTTFTFLVKPTDLWTAYDFTIWIDFFKWGYDEAAVYPIPETLFVQMTVRIEVKIKAAHYSFTSVNPSSWSWNEGDSTLHCDADYRSHGDVFRTLAIGFYCKEKSEALCVILGLNFNVDEKEDLRDTIALGVAKAPSAESVKRILVDAERRRRRRGVETSSVKNLKASIRSRRVFHHIISTLKITETWEVSTHSD